MTIQRKCEATDSNEPNQKQNVIGHRREYKLRIGARLVIDDRTFKKSTTDESFWNKYKFVESIAKGGYGAVCKGKFNFFNIPTIY